MLRRKGQSTLEYAMIIAVVVAGLLLLQHYIRRGYAGRLKAASEQMGEQYDPTAYSANFTLNQHSRTQRKVQNRVTSTTHLEDEIDAKTGREHLNAWGVNESIYSK